MVRTSKWHVRREPEFADTSPHELARPRRIGSRSIRVVDGLGSSPLNNAFCDVVAICAVPGQYQSRTISRSGETNSFLRSRLAREIQVRSFSTIGGCIE